MELLVILLVALLLFGGKKIPELAKGLGEGIRNFKESLKGPKTNRPHRAPTKRSRRKASWRAPAVWARPQSVL